MWRWIKARTTYFALRVTIAALPVMATIDMFVISNYERFIADPLQVRGISLSMQVRTLYVIGAFRILLDLPLSLWNLVGFVPWLANAVFCKLSFLDPKPGEEISRNVGKLIVPLILGRCWLYFMFFMLIGVSLRTHLFYAATLWIILTCIIVTTSCDPKPPRPKRLRVLVHSTEGV